MLQESRWKTYNQLAWTELILSSPEDYSKEAEFYSKYIFDNSKIETKTLLHFGCGAGINDYTFKKYFNVTGVDISKGMLRVAKNLNPNIDYIHGDMRKIKLPQSYDAVAIPDSIGYMVNFEDLKKTITNANIHLKQGGVLLIVAQLREEFEENNFVYTGSKDEINITLFENNHFLDSSKEKYEAVFTYLIRKKGKLKIYNDRHLLALYPLESWKGILKDAGFEIKQTKLNNSYDRFVMNDGEYTQTMFICRKP